ncbi:hypothetical protein VPH35_063399 [Triticum aestivum]|uniref:Uncharacterized protein n=1 Tax=Aegilops tauschii TaxID=37682 RepID=M8C7R2_AEGTA
MERAALSLPFPDDLLLEILVRVKDDMAALFRCAMVCKLWHRLVANAAFPPTMLAGGHFSLHHRLLHEGATPWTRGGSAMLRPCAAVGDGPWLPCPYHLRAARLPEVRSRGADCLAPRPPTCAPSLS